MRSYADTDELRTRLRYLSQRELLATCAAFRVNTDDDSLAAVTRFALRELAQRALFLAERLEQVKLRLRRITEQIAPALIAIKGVGPTSPRRCSSPPATTPSD